MHTDTKPLELNVTPELSLLTWAAGILMVQVCVDQTDTEALILVGH